MKKMMMAAIVSLMMSGAAAAGYGLEGDRAEAGRKFDGQQLSGPLAVQITGEFSKAPAAEYNAEARDYDKLEVTAPPVPEDGPEEGGKKDDPAPAAGGGMMSGISGFKLAVILAIAAVTVLLVLGGGVPLAAISPAATAALFAAGAMAAGALAAYNPKAPAKPE